MTQGPVRLDVSVSYALPRTGIPSAVSFRKWVAAALAGDARVTAVEPAEHRADFVERNTAGLPVDVLRVDGRESGLEPASFDRVLVDAPCTGLGALRRRPEARSRWVSRSAILMQGRASAA